MRALFSHRPGRCREKQKEERYDPPHHHNPEHHSKTPPYGCVPVVVGVHFYVSYRVPCTCSSGAAPDSLIRCLPVISMPRSRSRRLRLGGCSPCTVLRETRSCQERHPSTGVSHHVSMTFVHRFSTRRRSPSLYPRAPATTLDERVQVLHLDTLHVSALRYLLAAMMTVGCYDVLAVLASASLSASLPSTSGDAPLSMVYSRLAPETSERERLPRVKVRERSVSRESHRVLKASYCIFRPCTRACSSFMSKHTTKRWKLALWDVWWIAWSRLLGVSLPFEPVGQYL